MSDQSTPTAPPRYQVIAQTPQLVSNGQGGYVQGYRVTAQISASGTTFYVEVPMTQYNAANVAAALEQMYVEVAAVDGLTG